MYQVSGIELCAYHFDCRCTRYQSVSCHHTYLWMFYLVSLEAMPTSHIETGCTNAYIDLTVNTQTVNTHNAHTVITETLL